MSGLQVKGMRPWVACLTPLLLVSVAGCGGGAADANAGNPPQEESSIEGGVRVPPPPQNVVAAKQEPKPGPARPQAAGNAAVPRIVPKPKPPLVPVDLGQWTEKDFLMAHRIGDARLARAVLQRSANPRRTAEEAAMLVALIEAPATAEAAVPEAPAVAWKGVSEELARAVIAALAANKTEVARQKLVQFVNGDLPVPDRWAAMERALVPLVQDGPAEFDKVIVQAVTSFVQADPSDPTQDVKRRRGIPPAVLAALRGNTSASLRKRLALAILGEGIGQSHRDALLKMLVESQPANLEAEVAIYRSQVPDAAMRAALERQFTTASAEVVRMLGGFTKQSHANPPAPDWLGRVARELWSGPLAESLALAQEELVALADRPALMTLCTWIPTSAVRVPLRRTIARHWLEGPQAFRGMNQDGPAVEPGFLVVIKSVERENNPGKRSSEIRPSLSKRPKTARPVSEAAQRSEAWTRLTEELVRDYCRRCHLASLAQAAADAHAAQKLRDSVASECSVSFHSDSVVRAAYRFDLPGRHASLLTGLVDDSLRVEYLRIEDRAKMSRVMGYFRRQLKHGIERALGDGVWFDSLVETDQEGRLRSQDIVITRAKADSRSSIEEEQELTIEILTVDVRNPEG